MSHINLMASTEWPEYPQPPPWSRKTHREKSTLKADKCLHSTHCRKTILRPAKFSIFLEDYRNLSVFADSV